METGNPYLNAGLGLTFVGVGLAALRRSSSTLLVLLKKKYTVSLEITNRDPSFEWVLSSVQNFRKANHLIATYSPDKKTPFVLSPSPGTHLVKHRSRLLIIQRSRESNAITTDRGVPFESVKFTAFGTDTRFLTDILYRSRADAARQRENRTAILRSLMFRWENFGVPRTKRPLASVILAESIKEDIVADIAQFKSSQEWYTEKGIPYRRTYLFHGPPGSGKTSLVTALAGHFDANIASISLTENIKDDQFAHIINSVPENAFVLIEDIDAIFAERKIAGDGFKFGVTLSGLLNVLDGVMSTDERVTFLTTNHIEKLDAALIRPGRVDMIQRIGESEASQARELFLKFFPGSSAEAEEFGRRARGRSMAYLQGVLMKHREHPLDAIKEVQARKIK